MLLRKSSECKVKQAYLKDGTKVQGVTYSTLSTGKKMMVTVMYYSKDAVVPAHKHPHEQAGFVVSGKIDVQIGNEKEIAAPGSSYVVPGSAEHSIEALEDSQVIDVFSPPRDEYRD